MSGSLKSVFHKRGQTYYGSSTPPTDALTNSSVQFEGAFIDFPDTNPSATTDATPLSPGRVEGQIVRNSAGFALRPGRAVSWEAGYVGKRVDGYCDVTAELVAGVVDDCLPAAGVQDKDLFFLAQRGPHTVLTSIASGEENVIGEGVELYALTGDTNGATTSGRVIATPQTWTATQTTDGTATKAIQRSFAISMSANVTTQTNRSLRARLYCR